MRSKTILKLNRLNKKFYETTSFEFNQSRQYFWQGWKKILPHLNQDQPLKILDLGCGNGRFAKFLKKNDKKISLYYGVDNNQELLTYAQRHCKKSNIDFELLSLDLVDFLIDQDSQHDLFQELSHYNFNLIVLFGVLHHIPSLKLRKNIIKFSYKLLDMNSHNNLVFTSWQFIHDKRFYDRLINPIQVKIKPENLEENDYLLDWRRGQEAIRYCHYSSDKEIRKILSDTLDKKQKIYQKQRLFQWYSDGKSQKLNKYFMVKNEIITPD